MQPTTAMQELADGGGSRVVAFALTVENVAPIVDAGPDRTTYENDTLHLAPATFIDPGVADTAMARPWYLAHSQKRTTISPSGGPDDRRSNR